MRLLVNKWFNVLRCYSQFVVELDVTHVIKKFLVAYPCKLYYITVKSSNQKCFHKAISFSLITNPVAIN